MNDGTNFQSAAYAAAGKWQRVEVRERSSWQGVTSLKDGVKDVAARLQSTPIADPPSNPTQEAVAMLRANMRSITSLSTNFERQLDQLRELPFVRSDETILPRAVALCRGYLYLQGDRLSIANLGSWINGVSARIELLHDEIWLLGQATTLCFLERLVESSLRVLESPASPLDPIELERLKACLSSLKQLQEIDWTPILEGHVPFEAVLRLDPAGAYQQMDLHSRDRYRRRLVHLSKRSDMSEIQVARSALRLASRHKEAEFSDERVYRRAAHIGYYLIGEGVTELTREIGYHPTGEERCRTFIHRHPDDFYIGQVIAFTVFFIVLFTVLLVPDHSTLTLIGIAVALLILPATQGAVDVVNTLVTSILPAETLPKLDFSSGIPRDFMTLVAIPTLLLSEKQTRDLIHGLEVRYLANHDPNLSFALVTDLPDSLTPTAEEADPRVELAVSLINNLNQRYSHVGGRFLLLHRHPIFNKRQGVWMGWERKRGKLLDLNKLLKGEYDSFPVKAGDATLLHSVRFVITLDADTKLPPGSARQMVGTMAHPLNAAIVDADRNIVTAGYGILQPRVGISVKSATQSRLAALYSGETGYDSYTRAVSDAYQDLYGEGSFTGKGIYEVDTLHAVLNRRFPRNALLSHDLIEGAYARVGLVSDVEIIDDFPSHYSAHNRRKHRWVRGDWQTLQWLSARVPDESGNMVENPISTISRWKILDNLRRSLVEPVSFILLLAGWFVLPGGPFYWTLVTLGLLFLPALVQLAFSITRTLWHPSTGAFSDMFSGFSATAFHTLLILTFLPHQALLSLDAIVRSLVRSFLTGAHLLEWETAAEAEYRNTKPSVVDLYLRATPILAVGPALLLAWMNSRALIVASSILLLWVSEIGVVKWLNGSPQALQFRPNQQQELFLRQLALRTWRFFLDFSNDRHAWLIPDNFEEATGQEAARASPTNLGFLLNSRQAANKLGYLTLPELVVLTKATLDSTDRLEQYRGHFFNWYSTQTLQPLSPRVVSSVDSGNFAASLYTLSAGLSDAADQPILSNEILLGLNDHLQMLTGLAALPSAWSALAEYVSNLDGAADDTPHPRAIVLLIEAAVFNIDSHTTSNGDKDEVTYWKRQAQGRIKQACNLIRSFTPWLLPQFAEIAAGNLYGARVRPGQAIRWSDATLYVSDLLSALSVTSSDNRNDGAYPDCSLVEELERARQRTSRLLENTARAAERAFRMAQSMDFEFLVHPQRRLLRIGYEQSDSSADISEGKLLDACYDLLASEARVATFLAVAKGDVEQQSWFKMGRTHVVAYGQAALISWTGTMFEYLMPAIWMRSYPETMMAKSLDAAVHAHRAYAADTGNIPWGISECGHAGRDDMGNYGYNAFGIPQLALKWDATPGPVISPYSTCLALAAQPIEAVENLQRMAKMGWVGAYGFYEAADYTKNRANPELVKEWMAHHQGMSLVALLNVLQGNIMQDWFHANAHVEAAELILHEKPLSGQAVATMNRSRLPGKTPE